MDSTSNHIEEFKKHLAHLESDSKYIINLLTILARDLKQDKNFVTGIVNLLILYSKEVDCDVRAKLFKLRITWLGVFSNPELNRIDIKTREIDPAWPIITKAEESSKNRILSLPKIPKSKSKSEENSEQSNESPFNSTNPVRDPRLKRKSSPSLANDDNFMIDRGGARTSDGVVAKKISKREVHIDTVTTKESQNPNKSCIINPNINNKPWSNYISKYTELCSKEHNDVDMRVQKKQQHRDVVSVQPKTSRIDPRTKAAPLDDLKPAIKPAHRNPDLLPGPPIRGPDWNVEIEGYPDMIQIGIDPRLLSLSFHPKPPKTITIDRANYPLFLDRIHPLIRVNEYFHAVRFRCMNVEVIIDEIRYQLPGTGFRFIETDFGKLMACLGGPGHELIIDGRPHTVPMSGELTFINIKGKSVGVRFVGNLPQQVNVLPAIPPKILKWAAEQLFGSPSNLSKPPRNPFEQIKRLARGNENEMLIPTRLPQEHIHIPSLPVSSESQQQNSKPNVNVHDLFSKLMAAGIVGKKEEEPKPEICKVEKKKFNQILPNFKEYTWEKFKKFNEAEVENLFFGYQCSLCGIRFEDESSPEYAKHLDYHFIRNASDINSTGQNHHSWFQQASFWLRGELCNEGGQNLDDNCDSDDERPKCVASSDPNKNVCAVCREKFESHWDNEEDEWMIDNALFIDGQYFHPICREDAGKKFDEKETSLDETDASIANYSTSAIKKDPDDEERLANDNIENNDLFGDTDNKIKTESQDIKEDSLPTYSDIILNPLAALQNILGVDKLVKKK